MKRSITAFTAFIAMMGITSASRLSSLQEVTYAGYQPSSMQRTEIANLFNRFSDEHHDVPRMSFRTFANMVKNFEIHPEDRECSTHDDGDFYSAFMGNGCTGRDVNFSEPNIVRCDGVVVYCADAGKDRVFNDHMPDGQHHEAISLVQFRHVVESMNQELDDDSTGQIYKTLTDPGIAANGIITATYENVPIFANQGQGGEGYFEQNVTTTTGTKDHSTITHKVTAKVAANQRWVGGGINGSVTYDFTAVLDKLTTVDTVVSRTLNLKFNVPNYVYDQKITLEFADGSVTRIYGGMFISNQEGGEAFRRKLMFHDDGTVEEMELICGQCEN